MSSIRRVVGGETVRAVAGLCLTSILVMALSGCGASNVQPPAPVATFDIERYVGRWYEIARVPNSFQQDCAGDVTADYALRADGLMSVVNACREADGEIAQADGLARPREAGGVAKLEVTFVSVMGAPFWLAAGDYWVLGLDRDYKWAVVGSPDRDYGWILAREPTLPGPTLTYLTRLIEAKGYDACRFVFTESAKTTPRTLCDG